MYLISNWSKLLEQAHLERFKNIYKAVFQLISNFYNLKVILIKLNDQFYAMKSVNKFHALDFHIKSEFRKVNDIEREYRKVDYKEYLKEAFMEKEVGLLGNECRFLAKLTNAFQTEVNIH